jgi:FkbM family methyltransferase
MSRFHSLIKSCLNFSPFEIKRRQIGTALPPANMDNIGLALAYYMATETSPIFVQVGACDGTTGDTSHAFIVRGKMRAVLVEPIEQCFRKLKKVYQGVPNVTTVQAAVGVTNGELDLFKIKAGGSSIDPMWGTQLASFSKSHLLKHGVPEGEIERVRVPCLTLASLMTQTGLKRIDVLQVDTEGLDAEIVGMALDLPSLPECISFENVHLSPHATIGLFTRLESHGYRWTHDQWNTLALHESLTKRWR